jgi:hypothetical protein
MSTILHDNNFESGWIELQLAHVDKNTVRGTYNHAQYLSQRQVMLQWYADYLEGLEVKFELLIGLLLLIIIFFSHGFITKYIDLTCLE